MFSSLKRPTLLIFGVGIGIFTSASFRRYCFPHSRVSGELRGICEGHTGQKCGFGTCAHLGVLEEEQGIEKGYFLGPRYVISVVTSTPLLLKKLHITDKEGNKIVGSGCELKGFQKGILARSGVDDRRFTQEVIIYPTCPFEVLNFKSKHAKNTSEDKWILEFSEELRKKEVKLHVECQNIYSTPKLVHTRSVPIPTGHHTSFLQSWLLSFFHNVVKNQDD